MTRLAIFLAVVFFQATALSYDPESQIIIIDHFVSEEDARALIEFHEKEKQLCTVTADNEITITSSTTPHIRSIVSALCEEVLQIMEEKYDLQGKHYQVDHCGLYGRIVGNACKYHADNVLFRCPLHGKNQSLLRKICNGMCRGARFEPNHVGWREYTALFYLNDDFEGGEILFEDGPCNKIYQKVIPMKAGRVVITPCGSQFYHEVFPITRGKRYSLHIWFTTDPNHFHLLTED